MFGPRAEEVEVGLFVPLKIINVSYYTVYAVKAFSDSENNINDIMAFIFHGVVVEIPRRILTTCMGPPNF